MIGRHFTGVLFTGCNSQSWTIYLRICCFCNQGKYRKSKTKRHRPKTSSGSRKGFSQGIKALAQKENSVLDKYFNGTTSENAEKALLKSHTTVKMAET